LNQPGISYSSQPPPLPQANTGSADQSRISPLAFYIALGVIMAITEAVLFLFIHKPAIHPAVPFIPTEISTNTQIISIPILVPTMPPIATQNDCIIWSSLTRKDVGDTSCVFGRIVTIYATGPYKEIIRFSKEAGTFLIWDRETTVNLSVGDCVTATGIVQQDPSELFMDIRGTQFGEYSGCP
jgi:hypothetical protein